MYSLARGDDFGGQQRVVPVFSVGRDNCKVSFRGRGSRPFPGDVPMEGFGGSYPDSVSHEYFVSYLPFLSTFIFCLTQLEWILLFAIENYN